VVVIVGQLVLQLPVQTMPINTKVVSSNPVHSEVYSIQHYVIKFVSDLRQVSGFALSLEIQLSDGNGIQYFLPIYLFFHLTFRCYCFYSSNVPTLYSLLKLVNKSINIWSFAYWPCYMPLVLIMASDGCNGPRRCLGSIQPSWAIINSSGM
jgi:hypothetical protein